MDLNVDVVDNETGEIYLEGVTLKAARNFITKELGKIVREDIHIEELDDIDGGGQMEVHDIYVDFPEETLKRDLSASAIIRAREFWQYGNGGSQVRSRLDLRGPRYNKDIRRPEWLDTTTTIVEKAIAPLLPGLDALTEATRMRVPMMRASIRRGAAPVSARQSTIRAAAAAPVPRAPALDSVYLCLTCDMIIVSPNKEMI